MRCPKCNSNVYSHHQKINKSGTEIKWNYACRKCKYVFETIKQIIVTDKEVSKYIREKNTLFNERSDYYEKIILCLYSIKSKVLF